MSLVERYRRSETEKSGSHGPYVPALDGLRAVAVVAVIFFHFLPDAVPGGFLGVDVFFVLSGYLITSLLIREAESTGGIDLRNFYVRRVRRLWPASLMLVAVVILASALWGDPYAIGDLGTDGLFALANLANWHFIWDGQSYIENFLGRDPSVLRHMWSLAIEEQFYLFWPLVVLGLTTLSRSTARRPTRRSLRSLILVTVGALGVASITAMVVGSVTGTDINRLYYGTDTRIHILLVGVALAAVPVEIRQRAQGHRRAVSLLALVSLVGLVVAFLLASTDSEIMYRGGFVLVAVAVVPLILEATSVDQGRRGRHGLLGRVFASRAPVAVGKLSYSLYLWHWPMAVWIDTDSTGLDGVPLFVVRTLASVAAATVSYTVVERPIRHGGLRRIPRRWRPSAAIAALASVALVAWLVPKQVEVEDYADEPLVPGSEAISGSYYESPFRCDSGVLGLFAENLTVYEVGNSVAAEVEPCLEKIIVDQSGRYESRTNNAFAICDLVGLLDQNPIPRTSGRSAVVYFHLPFWNTGCGLQTPEDQREAVYEDALRDFVDDWMDKNFFVLLVVPPPPVTGGPDPFLTALYEELAIEHPDRVMVADAGRYVRTIAGEYVWTMPCTPLEVGCSSGGAITVRLPRDGLHFCADAYWTDGVCTPEYSGGRRRVAAAIAGDLFVMLGRG